jgi:hypothetical protein
MVRVTQSIYVSLAYRYWNSAWPKEKNLQAYGARASEEGMGGNWRVELGADVGAGERPDLEPHLTFLKSILDHRCLWEDVEAFRSEPSTPEAVCAHLAPLTFQRVLNCGKWSSLTIHESDRLSFTAWADGRAMSAEYKVNNLTLTCQARWQKDTNLALSREQITQAVRGLYEKYREPSADSVDVWAQSLKTRLKGHVENLIRLRVDLGRDRHIIVS